MLNTAMGSDHGYDEEPDDASVMIVPAADDLVRVAAALVQIDAWCRQRGMEELSRLLEPAVDWSDHALTGA